jgi:hypothetical protein
MEIEGKKFGETWELDARLATVAEELVAEFTEDLGHIDLERVVFARQSGLKGTAGDWLGKCCYIKEPYSLIPQCTLLWMARHGLSDFSRFEGLLNADHMDLRYIIALNDDLIPNIPGDQDLVERAILHHELKHIKYDMDGIEKHDTKDFRSVLHHYGVSWTSGFFNSRLDLEESS